MASAISAIVAVVLLLFLVPPICIGPNLLVEDRLINVVYKEIGHFLDSTPCFEVVDGEQTMVPFLANRKQSIVTVDRPNLVSLPHMRALSLQIATAQNVVHSPNSWAPWFSMAITYSLSRLLVRQCIFLPVKIQLRLFTRSIEYFSSILVQVQTSRIGGFRAYIW